MIHHIATSHDLIHSDRAVTHWPDVTCPACLLERPEAKDSDAGYRIPADITERDRALSLADRRKAQIAAVREVEDKALTEVAAWTAILRDAISLRTRIEAGTRQLDPQDFQDELAGYAQRWRGEAPWHP